MTRSTTGGPHHPASRQRRPPSRGTPPLRILFCTRDYWPGERARDGASKQARSQAEELVRRGHRVDVVCAATGGVASGPVNGVHVYRLPAARRRYLQQALFSASLAAFLAARLRRYDLVHVHLAGYYTHVAVLLGRLRRRPVYVKPGASGTAGDVARMRRSAWLTRCLGLRAAARVQALSQEIRRELRSIGIPEERIAVIANGVDPAIYHPAGGAKPGLRLRLGLPADKLVILTAGRLDASKGVPGLLAVWRSRPVPDAVLVLLGVRTESLDAAPAGDGVVWRGWTDDVAAYLRAADVFVLPSHREGMSNALLEAMACGLAVVASRVGAAAEMIVDGDSGLLIDAGDREALAAALGRLAADPALRRSLGERAAESARQRYSLPAAVDAIEGVYLEMLGEAPQGRRPRGD